MSGVHLPPDLAAVAAAVADAVGLRPGVPPGGRPAWDRFVSLAVYHRVVPLVRRSGWLAAARPPDAVADRLARAELRSTRHELRARATQARLCQVFARRGIEVLVLKGLALAASAYDDPHARQVGDTDLLVRPEDVPAAVAVLGREGFVLEPPVPGTVAPRPDEVGRLPALCELTFIRGAEHVDLHWRLLTNRRLLPIDPFAHGTAVTLDGVDVPTLTLPAAWWLLHVHGTKHAWRRLKWLADLPVVLGAEPGLVGPEALATVEALGIERCVATGLQVAEAVLGPFAGHGARRWARGVRGARRLVPASLGFLVQVEEVAPRPPTPEIARLAALTMRLRGDAAYRREELRIDLLRAGRAQGDAEPGARTLLAGPPRWTRRGVVRATSRWR